MSIEGLTRQAFLAVHFVSPTQKCTGDGKEGKPAGDLVAKGVHAVLYRLKIGKTSAQCKWQRNQSSNNFGLASNHQSFFSFIFNLAW